MGAIQMSIQSIEHKNTKGFQVRVYRAGKVITKFLAYKKYGGQRKALILARQVERQLEKLYPIVPSRKKKFHADKPNRNSTSGIAGIRAFISKGHGRRPIIQFHATWNSGGIQRSSQEYGLLGALQQILDARQNRTGLQMPTARKAWELIKRNKGW